MSPVLPLSGQRAAEKVLLVIAEDDRGTDTSFPAGPTFSVGPGAGTWRCGSLRHFLTEARLPTTDPPLKA